MDINLIIYDMFYTSKQLLNLILFDFLNLLEFVNHHQIYNHGLNTIFQKYFAI